jgi:hypothetical protein
VRSAKPVLFVMLLLAAIVICVIDLLAATVMKDFVFSNHAKRMSGSRPIIFFPAGVEKLEVSC